MTSCLNSEFLCILIHVEETSPNEHFWLAKHLLEKILGGKGLSTCCLSMQPVTQVMFLSGKGLSTCCCVSLLPVTNVMFSSRYRTVWSQNVWMWAPTSWGRWTALRTPVWTSTAIRVAGGKAPPSSPQSMPSMTPLLRCAPTMKSFWSGWVSWVHAVLTRFEFPTAFFMCGKKCWRNMG